MVKVPAVISHGQEVVDPDLLWYIHGKAYDLSKFMYTHPGGSEALATCRGRDITSLFESYHAFNMNKARPILDKMKPVEVSKEVLAAKVQDVSNGNWWFNPKDGKPDPFWATLVERCGKILKEPHMDTAQSWPRFYVAMTVLALQPIIYYFGFLSATRSVSFVSAVLLSLTFFVATQVAHDAGHFALSHRQWLNNALYIWASFGWTNWGLWQTMHQVHHMDTNIESLDPDLYHYLFFVRYFPGFPWHIMQRLQVLRLYCYIVWSFSVVGMVFVEPFTILTHGNAINGGGGPTINFHRDDLKRKAMLYGHTLTYLGLLLGIPVMLDTTQVGFRIASFLIYSFTTGIFLGILSQVNHYCEDCIDSARKNTSWAVRQVETAANFAPYSKFWLYLSGGFNIQIEHHLFPQVCTDRLALLVPTVRQTCKEFNVKYKEFDGMRSILASTHAHMEEMATAAIQARSPAGRLKAA